MSRTALLAAVTLALLPAHSAAFFIDYNANAFRAGDAVPLWVNKVFSDRTQLPYAYHELPFVCEKDNPQGRFSPLNLGEVLTGDRLWKSSYEIKMGEDAPCKVMCKMEVSAADAAFAKKLVQEDYQVEWLVDGLPGATARVSQDGEKTYDMGFPLGFIDDGGRTFLHNHVGIKILYQDRDDERRNIVGFEVSPKSLGKESEGCRSSLKGDQVSHLELDYKPLSVMYSYSVSFVKDDSVTWHHRWDAYLRRTDGHVHWYSIVNSMIILLFLSGMVAIIMLRTLNKDIALYNAEEDLKSGLEDTTGWKVLHGDVFRAPRYGWLLAALVGSGIQLFLMAGVTMSLAVLGFLNPSYRGGLISFALFLFVLMGFFAGYLSARLYKTFRLEKWANNALQTATIVPSVIFGCITFLNCFYWSKMSSHAIPAGTFFALVAMWFGISLPLIFVGAYFGNKKPAIEHPVRTHQIPRQIPDIAWYLRPLPSLVVAGLIPFAIIFLELFFVLKSVWNDQFYYLFGILGLVFLILVIACIEVTIVTTYLALSAEDYRWHWRAFWAGSSSVVYIFAYACYYFAARLQITEFTSGFAYFVYLFIGSFAYWLCTGTISFLSAYVFVTRLYAAVKID